MISIILIEYITKNNFKDFYSKIQAEKYSNGQCYLNTKHVFVFGPIALPNELKTKLKRKSSLTIFNHTAFSQHQQESVSHDGGLLKIDENENTWQIYLKNKLLLIFKPLQILLEAFEDNDNEEILYGELGTGGTEGIVNNLIEDVDENYKGIFI